MRYLLLVAMLTFGPTCRAGPDEICVQTLVVPAYPPVVLAARIQGDVTLQLEIGEDGKVSSATAKTSAHELLSKAAATNIREWTFKLPPGVRKFPISHTIVYTYKIVGQAGDLPLPVVIHLPDRVEIRGRPPRIVVN